MTQLSFTPSGVVTISPDPAIVAGALRLHGSPGVALGNVPIQLLPTDTAATLANRIALAVQAANDSGELPNVSAFGTGQLSHSVEFVGGFVLNASSGQLAPSGVSVILSQNLYFGPNQIWFPC